MAMTYDLRGADRGLAVGLGDRSSIDCWHPAIFVCAMMVRALSILIGLFCSLLAGCTESLPFDAASLRKPGDALDAAMQQWMTVQQSPGLVMAIVQDGKLATVRPYGLADVKSRK